MKMKKLTLKIKLILIKLNQTTKMQAKKFCKKYFRPRRPFTYFYRNLLLFLPTLKTQHCRWKFQDWSLFHFFPECQRILKIYLFFHTNFLNFLNSMVEKLIFFVKKNRNFILDGKSYRKFWSINFSLKGCWFFNFFCIFCVIFCTTRKESSGNSICIHKNPNNENYKKRIHHVRWTSK